MDKNKHIDSAARKFKQVSEPNKYHYQQKFKSLPYWLEESSHYFKLEANKELIDHYYYYPRGSVISVNFGVNEGSEFSNLHFAVVLNKRDSPQNRTLTVIPLTSKPKAGRFSLGKEIFNQTSNILSSTLADLRSHLNTQIERNKKLEDKVKELRQKRQHIEKAHQETDKKISSFISESASIDSTTDKKAEFSKLYEEMTKQITDLEKLNINATANDPNANVEIIGANNIENGRNLVSIVISNDEETTVYQIDLEVDKRGEKEKEADNIITRIRNIMKYATIGIFSLIGIIILAIIITIIVKACKKHKKNKHDLD